MRADFNIKWNNLATKYFYLEINFLWFKLLFEGKLESSRTSVSRLIISGTVAATNVWRLQRASSNWWWKNARPMPWDRDGPSRITIHRSCDTAPFRVVIPTIAITLLIAPDLGYQGNDFQSPKPALVDKSREFRKTLRKFLRNRSESLDGPTQTPRVFSRNDHRE